MHNVIPVETKTELQLTDEDKIRIGVAWDALSPNSRRAYQLTWRQLNDFLSTKGETLDNITDTQLAAYISSLDAKGIAPNTLSVNLAAVKWYFSNVKGSDVRFSISQKRLKSIRRDAKGRGNRWITKSVDELGNRRNPIGQKYRFLNINECRCDNTTIVVASIQTHLLPTPTQSVCDKN